MTARVTERAPQRAADADSFTAVADRLSHQACRLSVDAVEKRFEGGLRATLIQDGLRTRKIDHEVIALDSIVARRRPAADFFKQYRHNAEVT
jgi:hypothetical protein